MSDALISILFGVVQGITEFLPVSSSGHLVLLHSIADFSHFDALAFDVALHVGTTVALVWVFRSDLKRVVSSWLQSFGRGSKALTVDARLGWLLLLGTIPAAIAGLLLESAIETSLRQPTTVAIALIVGGIALWAADRFTQRASALERTSAVQAWWIGLGQALALIPGVSRAGATMTVGRLVGLDRVSAARFSFLLAIPIVLAAGIKQGIDLAQTPERFSFGPFLIGMVSAGLVGIWAIQFLLRFVRRRSFSIFAFYRIALGILILVFVQ